MNHLSIDKLFTIQNFKNEKDIFADDGSYADHRKCIQSKTDYR